MKKFLFLLFVVPFCAIAQDTTSRFQLGVSFRNDWCDRFSKADATVSDQKSVFDSLETARYGFALGAVVAYELTSHFSIQSGVGFSSRGFAIDTLKEAGLVNMKYGFQYLEIPVRAAYVFSNERKIKPILSLGINAGFLVRQQTKFQRIGLADDRSFSDENSLSGVSFGVMASVGFQRKIQEDFYFQLEGVFCQSLTSISDTPFKRYLNSTGLNLSIVRLF